MRSVYDLRPGPSGLEASMFLHGEETVVHICPADEVPELVTQLRRLFPEQFPAPLPNPIPAPAGG
jgi:hypothetical protein